MIRLFGLGIIGLFVIDILLLLTVAAPLRYNSPNWIKLPGAVIYALIFRRDLLGCS